MKKEKQTETQAFEIVEPIGKAHSGRKVRVITDVVLGFEAQTEIQGEIVPCAPVILRVKSQVRIPNLGERISIHNKELVSPTALSANLCRCQSLLKAHFSDAVGIE